jgi:hypothetical protein
MDAAQQGFGNRVDGTEKGLGFFGALSGKDTNKVSTEISIGVNIDGKETQIPSIVPTLTGNEVSYLINGGKPTKDIVNKAIEHARKRMAQGKSPFADRGEQTADLHY